METEKKQGKRWLALLLSLLVCVGGAILWGVLYAEGWFASIVAYVTAFCAFLVYEKVNKEITKGTLAWVLIWVITLNIIASFLSIVISCAIIADVSFSQALNATLSVFDQVVGDFAFDMVLGIVFSVLGVVTYYQYQKRAKKVKEAQEQMLQAQIVNQQNQENATDEKVDEQPKTEVLRCSQCGGRLKENSKTCEFCGKKN